MGFANFGNELKKAINRAGIKKTIDATVVVEAAKGAITETYSEDLASELEPIFFRQKTITIKATSGVAAQEARLQERMLIDTINKRLGKDEVLYITIRQ